MMIHGAGIYKIAKKLKCSPDEITDFSSNINLYQPEISLNIKAKNIARYADSNYSDLKKIIAQKFTIKKKQISLYNGATSAIFSLFSSLNEKNIYLYSPLYGEYEKAAKITKKNIYKINRFKKIKIKIKKNSIVVFVNPSTPDAKYYNLGKLFNYWKSKECTIIIDESFLEFTNNKSFIKKLNKYNKLYFIKSFTKFYSCAGVRIGAILSKENNLKKLHTPLWNLSTLDVDFLKQRLQDKHFYKCTIKNHIIRKKELKSILNQSQLFSKIYKSDANFYLVKSNIASSIFNYLLTKKILVRTCNSFDFLDKYHLRFAVKDKLSHQKLQKALADFYSLYRG